MKIYLILLTTISNLNAFELSLKTKKALILFDSINNSTTKGCKVQDGQAQLFFREVNAYLDNLPIRCKKSKAPIFKDKKMNDVLEVSITTDFDWINRLKDRFKPGTFEYLDEDGNQKIEPIYLSSRGNSRWKTCKEQKPLKISFPNDQEREKIKNKYEEMNPENNINIMYQAAIDVGFYKNKAAMNIYPVEYKRLTSKRSEGLFKKLGRDIKIVTHCGQSMFQPDGQSAQDIEDVLLAEYTIYQIFEEFGTLNMETRLAKIHYKNPDGSIRYSNYAFFREPKQKLAKRCNLDLLSDEDAKLGVSNTANDLQYSLQQAFIGNQDYRKHGKHNNITFSNSEKSQHYSAPYDYDFTGIISKKFENISKVKTVILSLIANHPDNKEATAITLSFLEKKEKMRGKIKNSLMSDKKKEEMLNYFDSVFPAFQEALDQLKKRHRRDYKTIYKAYKSQSY